MRTTGRCQYPTWQMPQCDLGLRYQILVSYITLHAGQALSNHTRCFGLYRMLNRCIDDHVLVNGLCISEAIRVEANMFTPYNLVDWTASHHIGF